ncbi:hypothetical protein AAFF_G00057340 [Aldrovandia affinis]|uniref:Uncharacterized protein n=1 Tax=Aldrovandia affinis TaxID=143900 RepID=A0AAD7S0L9_9TELE|nr:hypothetical protein AAFF_G00057340 [Aldrovandia affinis]
MGLSLLNSMGAMKAQEERIDSRPSVPHSDIEGGGSRPSPGHSTGKGLSHIAVMDLLQGPSRDLERFLKVEAFLGLAGSAGARPVDASPNEALKQHAESDRG